MSLLLKALQNAAKNREAGAPADEASAAAEDRPSSGTSLELEPVEPAPRAAAAPKAPGAGVEDFADRGPGPGQQQAQNLLRAGRSQPPAASSPGIIDWLARRPLVAFSTAAGLFAIGYGIYLYLQITDPGLFTARPVAPPPSPPVAAAPPPAPGVPPLAQTSPALPSTADTSVAAQPAVPPAAVAPGPVAAPTAPAPPAGTVADARPPGQAPTPALPATGQVGGTAEGPLRASAPAAAPQRPAMAHAPGSVVPAGPVASVSAREPAKAARARPAPRHTVTAPAKVPVEGGAAPGTAQVVAVDAGLMSAYQALEKGQLNDAERLYRQALASDPRNIDAMLGLASTMVQQNKADAAVQLYVRVLEQDPRNAHAQAGLLNVGGRADPAAAEARLKQLIAREPSAFLYFSLGNLYADQRQWAAAQSAYFQAYNLAPDNPDYAFNLAVGLEHLSQPKLAMDYYRRAVSLAQNRGHAQFALAQAQTRIQSLEATLAERP